MTQAETVKSILSDGQWHTSAELKKATAGYAMGLSHLRRARVGIETRSAGLSWPHGATKDFRLAPSKNTAPAAKPDTNGHAARPLSREIEAAALIASVSVGDFILAAAQKTAEQVLADARKALAP